MKYCVKCGMQMPDEATICNTCGTAQNINATPAYTAPPVYGQLPASEPDKVNVGFCILAWFCPLFALIYFLVKKSEKPKGTKTVGIVGLVSFILNMVVMIITFAMTGSILNKTIDAIGNAEPGVVIESQWPSDNSFFTENIQSASKDDQVAINGELDWKNMMVIIDHSEVNLPCAYAEFSQKTGYSLAENQSDYLNANQYTLPLKATNARGREMQIRFYNSGDASKPLQECSVIGISVDDWKNNYADVTFPGNIKIGNVFGVENFTKMFGEPSNTYNGDSGYTTVSWDDNDDLYNEFKIVSDDGKTVSEISVKVFPWE